MVRVFIGRNLKFRPGVQLNPVWTPEAEAVAGPAPPAPPPPAPPPAPPPPPSLLLSAPEPPSGVVGGPGGRGFVTLLNGTAPVPFTLSTAPAGASITPASGTVSPDVPVEYVITASVPNVYTISLNNAAGIANPPPVQYTATGVGFTLSFEGIGSGATINNFYNGGTDSQGNSGVNYGVAFGSNALALRQSDPLANFALPPSAETIMFFLDGSAILNYPAGFFGGFSFWYTTTGFTGAVRVYEGVNATGALLGTITLSALGTGPVPDDPFSNWAIGALTFPGTARSIDFGGTVNQAGYDNITFGSANPSIPAPPPPAAPAPPAPKPAFENVKVLLRFDGTNGSTAFVDSSSAARAVTSQRGAVISGANARFDQCGAFGKDTPTDFSSVRVAHSADLNVDSADFGFAFFIRPEAAMGAQTTILQKGDIDAPIRVFCNSGGSLIVELRGYSGSGLVSVSRLTALPINQYSHVAFSKIGTVIRLFVNGEIVQTALCTFAIGSSTQPLCIGSNFIANSGFEGRIDELIFFIGEGVFSDRFTPPTAPFSWP